MRLFEGGRFDGNLAELIDRCMIFVPTAQRLAEADRWLAELELHGRLLPIRKFARRANRGEVFSVGHRRFVPVDNETLAHIHRELLLGNVPQGDLEDLYRQGTLTLSWKTDTARTDLGSRLRTGQVAAPFRDEGLKLAHLIDAARGVGGSSEEDFVQRFRLALNPLNCFPFPSPKRFRFERVHGYADPGEAPVVQKLLAAALAEHAGAAFVSYRSRVGGSLDLPARWREIARDLPIRFVLRRSEAGAAQWTSSGLCGHQETVAHTGFIDSDLDAVTPRGRPLRFESLDAFIDAMRDWRRECPNAKRLNGHRTFLKPDRATGSQAIRTSDPTPYVYVRLTRDCLPGIPDAALRRWRLHGDTKARAIDELIDLYEAQDSFDGIFRQLPTQTQQKLILQGRENSDGLYCYG